MYEQQQKLYKYIRNEKHITCVTVIEQTKKSTALCKTPEGLEIYIDLSSWYESEDAALEGKMATLRLQLRNVKEEIDRLLEKETDIINEISYFIDVKNGEK